MQYDVTIKILSLWRCWKIWVNGKLVNCELSTEINDQHMATTTTSKSFHRRDSYWSGGGHLVVIFCSKLRCITSLSRFLVHSEPIFGNWTPQKDPFRLPKLTSIIQKTFVCKSLKNKRNTSKSPCQSNFNCNFFLSSLCFVNSYVEFFDKLPFFGSN